MATEARPGGDAPPRLLWQNAIIRAIEPRTPRVRSFFFELPSPFTWRAGQHVDVRLTADDGYQAQRSYSIASAPSVGGLLELAIERLDDGEVSPFFHDVAAVGDTIELRGPIGGYFIWSPDEEGALVLVGGGSGVVPLLSMLRERAAQDSRVPALLVYSARSWNEVICRDELVALEGRQDGFELVFALTRAAAKRERDYSRRIDADLLHEALARIGAPPRHVFVCGSNPFVETAADGLLRSGVSAAMIRTERYGQ